MLVYKPCAYSSVKGFGKMAGLEKSLAAITLVLLVSAALYTIAVTNVVASSAPSRVVFIYAPHVNLTKVAEELARNNVTHAIFRVEVDEQASPDYWHAWALTGARFEANTSMLALNESLAERIVKLWFNATLIDIPVVTPEKHNYTINPLSNITLHLQPLIMKVPVNSSVEWSELGTNISVVVLGSLLEVRLDAYNITLVATNYTRFMQLGPRAVSINNTVKYYIVLYIVSVDDYYVELFFPGAMPTEYYMSSGISSIEWPIIPWYLPLVKYSHLLAELPSEIAVKWISISAESTLRMLSRALQDTNTAVYHVYMPHLLLLKEVAGKSELFASARLNVSSLIATYIYWDILAKDPSALVLLVNFGEDAGALFAGSVQISNTLSIDLTASQLVGIILSYSPLLPFNHAEIVELSKAVKNLKSEVEATKSNLTQMELELNNTKSALQACQGDLDLAQSKLVNLEELEKQARNLYSTAIAYITMGLGITVAVSMLLGYLAYRVSKKK